METDIPEEDLEELTKKLSDPLWRIRTLYQIVDKKGNNIPFRPTKSQERLIEAYYVEGRKRHIILKARRMGFSTLIDLILFDRCYWGKILQASIVDLTQSDASEKLKTKIRVAYQSLPEPLKESLRASNEHQIEFNNGSTINAGKNARGGTNQLLHVSELGPIAHVDPRRAEEVKTGALPSADEGDIFIESTFKGGKHGVFYEMIKTAMETPDEHKTQKDYYLHFFPWYEDETLVLEGDIRAVQPDTNAYLDEKELELGVKFSDGQRLWFHVTKKEQGIFMTREYPTTVEEAFSAPVEGAIYADLIEGIRANGQIKDFNASKAQPVFVAMDIGWNDQTTAWMFQLEGRDIVWLWYYESKHATAADFMTAVRATEFEPAAYFLPHDAGSASAASNGVTYKHQMEEAGATNCVVLPRPQSVWAGINAARELISKSYFHRTSTALGVEMLEAYHTKPISAGGVTSREPVHDYASHGSDAFRYAAESIVLGYVKTYAGRKARDTPPAGIDGVLVNIDALRQNRMNKKKKRAKMAYRL